MSDSVSVTHPRTFSPYLSHTFFHLLARSGTSIFFLVLTIFISLAASLPAASQNRITHIVSRGPFDASMRHFVHSRLQEAERTSPDHIVLELQSRSGRIDYVLDVAEELNRCETPISVYVSARLEGPAIILALAGDKLFLHSNAKIQLGKAASRSIRTSLFRNGYAFELAARFASIAKRNGYPPDLVRAMVNPSLQLNWLPGKSKTLLTDDRLNRSSNRSDISVRETVSQTGQLMSLTPGDASRFGLTGDPVSGWNDVLAVLSPDGSRQTQIQTKTWSIPLSFTRIFTEDLIWALLIILGTAAALLEIRRPGTGWSGGLAVVMFCLPVFTCAYLGLVSPPVMILLLLGLCSLALDTLLIPGISILGFLGLLPTICSLILARNPFLLPDVARAPWEVQYLFDSFSAGLISLGLGIATYSLLVHFYSERLFTLTLIRASTNGAVSSDPAVHPDKLIGTRGTIRKPIRPIGTIELNGRSIQVVTQHFYLEPGTTIEIKDVEGLRLSVRVL